MAMNYPKSTNPFEDDDDDFGFSKPNNGGNRYGGNEWDDEDDFNRAPMTKEERLQMMKEKSMNNQLESTRRAMASIIDSEATGIATAEVRLLKLI